MKIIIEFTNAKKENNGTKISYSVDINLSIRLEAASANPDFSETVTVYQDFGAGEDKNSVFWLLDRCFSSISRENARYYHKKYGTLVYPGSTKFAIFNFSWERVKPGYIKGHYIKVDSNTTSLEYVVNLGSIDEILEFLAIWKNSEKFASNRSNVKFCRDCYAQIENFCLFYQKKLNAEKILPFLDQYDEASEISNNTWEVDLNNKALNVVLQQIKEKPNLTELKIKPLTTHINENDFYAFLYDLSIIVKKNPNFKRVEIAMFETFIGYELKKRIHVSIESFRPKFSGNVICMPRNDYPFWLLYWEIQAITWDRIKNISSTNEGLMKYKEYLAQIMNAEIHLENVFFVPGDKNVCQFSKITEHLKNNILNITKIAISVSGTFGLKYTLKLYNDHHRAGITNRVLNRQKDRSLAGLKSLYQIKDILMLSSTLKDINITSVINKLTQGMEAPILEGQTLVLKDPYLLLIQEIKQDVCKKNDPDYKEQQIKFILPNIHCFDHEFELLCKALKENKLQVISLEILSEEVVVDEKRLTLLKQAIMCNSTLQQVSISWQQLGAPFLTEVGVQKKHIESLQIIRDIRQIIGNRSPAHQISATDIQLNKKIEIIDELIISAEPIGEMKFAALCNSLKSPKTQIMRLEIDAIDVVSDKNKLVKLREAVRLNSTLEFIRIRRIEPDELSKIKASSATSSGMMFSDSVSESLDKLVEEIEEIVVAKVRLRKMKNQKRPMRKAPTIPKAVKEVRSSKQNTTPNTSFPAKPNIWTSALLEKKLQQLINTGNLKLAEAGLELDRQYGVLDKVDWAKYRSQLIQKQVATWSQQLTTLVTDPTNGYEEKQMFGFIIQHQLKKWMDELQELAQQDDHQASSSSAFSM